MIKKAMILAAGFGRRLHPLTLNCPKPLLKIGNETLLSNTIKFLEQYGIKKIVINVHYLSDQIINYIKKNQFNLEIILVKEKGKILNTGGGILNVVHNFSNEPFLVINPDTIWNSSYLEELRLMEKEFFINRENKCFLLIVNNKKSFDQSLKGDFNLENKLINRKNKENLKYIYTGVQILRPDIFQQFSLKIFSLNKIWDYLIQNNILFGKESDIEFLHVSTLNIYKSLLEKYFKH